MEICAAQRRGLRARSALPCSRYCSSREPWLPARRRPSSPLQKNDQVHHFKWHMYRPPFESTTTLNRAAPERIASYARARISVSSDIKPTSRSKCRCPYKPRAIQPETRAGRLPEGVLHAERTASAWSADCQPPTRSIRYNPRAQPISSSNHPAHAAAPRPPALGRRGLAEQAVTGPVRSDGGRGRRPRRHSTRHARFEARVRPVACPHRGHAHLRFIESMGARRSAQFLFALRKVSSCGARHERRSI